MGETRGALAFLKVKKSVRTAESRSRGGRNTYRNTSAGLMPSHSVMALLMGPMLHAEFSSCMLPPAVQIIQSGQTSLLPGEMVDLDCIELVNDCVPAAPPHVQRAALASDTTYHHDAEQTRGGTTTQQDASATIALSRTEGGLHSPASLSPYYKISS